jgi:hypothetical protein
VGVAICYCVASIRKWARRLCIFFNIIMVPMYLLFAIAFAQGGKTNLFILTALVAASFGLSLYYLLQKKTALFFSPPENDKEPEPDDPARDV